MDAVPYNVEELLAGLEPPKCEYNLQTRDLCGEEAHWLIAIACGCSYYMCDPHQARTEAMVTTAGAPLRCARHVELGPLDGVWRKV